MKRAKLPFDTDHFRKVKEQGTALSTEKTFREIFESNHWAGSDSISGQGSDDRQTAEISQRIPELLKQIGIKTFLDVPCGDFHWFSKMQIDLELYTGGDILPEIIDQNNRLYGSDRRKFIRIDLIQDQLPNADILFCRDCFVHLSYGDILSAIANIRRSNITYLLTTTFPQCDENQDIVTGDWRIINLEKPPFSYPKPISLINEKCTEGRGTYSDKSLGLWKISDI
jgi:hypothetical protein